MLILDTVNVRQPNIRFEMVRFEMVRFVWKVWKLKKDGPNWFGTGFMIKKTNDFVWILDMSKNLTVWQPNECQNVKNPNVQISDIYCIQF